MDRIKLYVSQEPIIAWVAEGCCGEEDLLQYNEEAEVHDEGRVWHKHGIILPWLFLHCSDHSSLICLWEQGQKNNGMTNLVCDVVHKNDMIPGEIGRGKQPSK